jgi:hypothetical protein
MQDVACRIMIPIHHQPAVRAGMGAVAQRLLHEFTAGRTQLRGVCGADQYDRPP